MTRINCDYLLLLKQGWYDGDQGEAFHPEELGWFTDTWERTQPDGIKLPYFYPTVEGEVQAEWLIGNHEVVFRVNLKKRTGYWLCMNTQSDDDEDRDDIHLDNPEEWNWIFQKIADIQEKYA